MNTIALDRVKSWFDTYVSGYTEGDPEYRQNIMLKINHSRMVADNITLIANSEGMSGCDVELAGIIGILHDVGRFPQYRQYRTFKDSASCNHGELGSEIIESEGAMIGLPVEDIVLVCTAVRYHNSHKVPHLGDERAETFIRLVRDADKVDIWRVLLEEFYELPPDRRATAAGLSLPASDHCTPEVVAQLEARRVVMLSQLKNLQDFILMLLSWCHDINFSASYRLLIERGYFERYERLLGNDKAACRALESVREFSRGKAG